MKWYDNPIFDEEVERVGQHRFVGDAWRRLQQLKEQGVKCHDVFSVAGTTFRASTVKAVVEEGVRNATLEPEATNPFDPNAVKVLVNGRHVGYVPAVRAASVRTGPVHVCNIGTAPNPFVWLVWSADEPKSAEA